MGRTKAIPGASFTKETVGGRWQYWRARVGKKLTGDKPIRRRFSTYGDAVQWVSCLIEERKKHGTEVFSLSHSQLSEARSAFQRLQVLQVVPASPHIREGKTIVQSRDCAAQKQS
jgi:hypothetical protein